MGTFETGFGSQSHIQVGTAPGDHWNSNRYEGHKDESNQPYDEEEDT